MKKLILKIKRYIIYRKIKNKAEEAAQIRADLVGWDCDGYYCCDCPFKATPETCEVLHNLLDCLTDYYKYQYDFVIANYDCIDAGMKDRRDLPVKIDDYSVDVLENKYQKECEF